MKQINHVINGLVSKAKNIAKPRKSIAVIRYCRSDNTVQINIKYLIIGAALCGVMSMPSSHAQVANGAKIDLQSDIENFCGNIVDPARDRRYLIQRVELGKLQSDVDERIKILEERRDEYKEWLDRRNEFLKTAEAGLVEIFKKMKPDAAASQLEIINKNVSAAIIMKLNASLSSRIFNEMDPEVAASLATIIATAAATENEDGSDNPT